MSESAVNIPTGHLIDISQKSEASSPGADGSGSGSDDGADGDGQPLLPHVPRSDEVFENGNSDIEDDANDGSVELRASKRRRGRLLRRRRRGPRNRRSSHLGGCAIAAAVAAAVVAIVFIVSAFIVVLHLGGGLDSPQMSSPLSAHSPSVPSKPSSPSLPPTAACSRISVRDVWTRRLPGLSAGGPLRLLDVNRDGVLDLIVPYGAGADTLSPLETKCAAAIDASAAADVPDSAANDQLACVGGLAALDGATGRTIWRHRLEQRPLALSCEADITRDGLPDCVVSGRGGLMSAHDGATGARLWRSTVIRGRKTCFTVQPIGDVDDDGVPDFVQARGGSSKGGGGSSYTDDAQLKGELSIVSGASGSEVVWQYVPDRRELHFTPQLVSLEGAGASSWAILYASGGDSTPGALYLLRLKTFLITGETAKSRPIVTSRHKGPAIAPAALADLTLDGRPDAVLPLLNGSVAALDGSTGFRRPLWRVDFPGGEAHSPPVPGYFNGDSVPDFFVQYSVGPGYPVYRYQRFAILDGRTGRVIKELPRASASAFEPPLAIGFEGAGHDLFLHWRRDCHRKQPLVGAQWRPCRWQFNATPEVQLLLVGQHISWPGISVYTSHQPTDGPTDPSGFGFADRPWTSAAALAPAFGDGESASSSSVDVAFAIGSAEGELSPELDCFQEFLDREANNRFNPASDLFGLSARRYRDLAVARCAAQLGRPADASRFALRFRKLTIYRKRISCHCSTSKLQQKSCRRILPFAKQRWTAYMGNRGDAYLRNP